MQNAKCEPSQLTLNVTCDQHKQPIVGVLQNPSKGKRLKCFCCVQEDKLDLNKLINLNIFQVQAAELRATLSGLKRVKIDQDLSLIDYSDNIEQLKFKIEDDKKKIRGKFDDLIEDMTLLCNKKYQEVADMFDNELNTITQNIKTYNNMINDCLGESQLDSVLIKLGSAKEQIQSENLMSEYMNYFEFSKVVKNGAKDKYKNLSKKIKQIKNKISEQLSTISQTSFNDKALKTIGQVKQKAPGILEPLKQIGNSIIPLTVGNIEDAQIYDLFGDDDFDDDDGGLFG